MVVPLFLRGVALGGRYVVGAVGRTGVRAGALAARGGRVVGRGVVAAGPSRVILASGGAGALAVGGARTGAGIADALRAAGGGAADAARNTTEGFRDFAGGVGAGVQAAGEGAGAGVAKAPVALALVLGAAYVLSEERKRAPKGGKA